MIRPDRFFFDGMIHHFHKISVGRGGFRILRFLLFAPGREIFLPKFLHLLHVLQRLRYGVGEDDGHVCSFGGPEIGGDVEQGLLFHCVARESINRSFLRVPGFITGRVAIIISLILGLPARVVAQGVGGPSGNRLLIEGVCHGVYGGSGEID